MASSELDFVNPPPFGIDHDFTQNTVYTMGSMIMIQWGGGDPSKATSIGLFQVDPSLKGGEQYLQPFEHVIQSVINMTTFRWIVTTQKSLNFSNIFILTLFEEGKLSADSNSHYFNITANPSAFTTILSTIVPTASSTTSPATDSSSAANASDSTGLPASTAIGLGIGITCFVILAVAGSWCLFRWRRKRGGNPPAGTAAGMQEGNHVSDGSMPKLAPTPVLEEMGAERDYTARAAGFTPPATGPMQELNGKEREETAPYELLAPTA